MAGASAIQVGTANFVKPLAMPEILQELEDWMRDNDVDSIPDLVGVAHRQ